MSHDDFLSRWSRRKVQAREGNALEPAPVAPPDKGIRGEAADAAPSPAEAPPLPPVESLTPESDFTPFMKADVDPGVKRDALKTLFKDPRFNVMDGLDVYIDDYSKPDPLPPEWLAQMRQMKYLGHYIEEEPAGEKKEAVALQEAMPEQPLALPEGEPPVDTSSGEKPPVEVGESGVSRNGNS